MSQVAYFGEYSYNIDQASRLTVPARFREDVGTEVILYRAPEGCLFLYDTNRFDEVRKSVDALSGTPSGRQMIRYFYSDVASLSVDRTGRFIIPPEFISFAGLKTEVVILGVGERIEIWDKEVYMSSFGDRDAIPMSQYPEIQY